MQEKQGEGGMFRAERIESAVDRVLNIFKDALITGELTPGMRLPSEHELSTQLSVSRGSIREAMKILSAFGIVEIRRGHGSYIAESDHKVVFDPLLFSLIVSNAKPEELVELRELMEFAVVKLVVRNAADEDLTVIENSIREMQDMIGAGDRVQPALLAQSDIDFHNALGRASKNRLVEKIYAFIMNLFAPSIRVTHENQINGRNALECHKKIVAALKKRDHDEAITAVDESIMEWKKLTTFVTRGSGGEVGRETMEKITGG
jgi:GntR family transcriptional repressor for pyruvate dehydrogenase complex